MPRAKSPPRLIKSDRGIWYVAHWNGERTVRASLGTTDEAEAQVRFGYWLVEQDHADPDTLTVGDLLTFYWKEHVELHAADPDRIDYALARLRPFFGHWKPSDIKPNLINKYVAQRRAGPATIRRELTVLTAAFNHAAACGRVTLVPKIPKPKAPPPKDRWLSKQEIDKLLLTAELRRQGTRLSRAERFCWIALEAPARRRSIERLSWTQVDLERRLIDFRTPGKTQTKKRQVPIPISDKLLPILQRAYDERQNDLWVLDEPNPIRWYFEQLVDAAGLPGVTPHTLRHTAATHMAQAGVPLAMIAQILGNTVAVVEKTYAHWQSDALREAVNYGR